MKRKRQKHLLEAAVILNPSACSGRAMHRKRYLEKCLRQAGVSAQLFVSESEPHLRELVITLARKYATLGLAGGDSTLAIAVNELLRAGIDRPVAFLPMGSCNDMAHEFAINSLATACRMMARKRIRRLDVGIARVEKGASFYFLGQLSLGLGVEVNRRMEANRRSYLLRHVPQGVAGAWFIYRSLRSADLPLELHIEMPQLKLEGKFDLAVIANISYYASGIRLIPQAVPDDGALDLFLLAGSFWRISQVAIQTRRGLHLRNQAVQTASAAEFRISADKPFYIQTEGEIFHTADGTASFREVEVTVLPQAFSLIV